MGSFNDFLDAEFRPPRNWSLNAPLKFKSETLTNEERESIKVLSQGAALRFLLTRVFDALNTVEGAIVKIKDPMEYLKRLDFHKNAKNYEDYFF